MSLDLKEEEEEAILIRFGTEFQMRGWQMESPEKVLSVIVTNSLLVSDHVRGVIANARKFSKH